MARKARKATSAGCESYPGGKVLCHVNKYGGAMRKRGNWRAEFKDRETEALDACAGRKVPPMGVHGLIVRSQKTA